MTGQTPVYKEFDNRSAWEKVAIAVTAALLILLIPTTVLGYFSESSIPGQPLYPVKRSIEAVVLLVESLTPYREALYYQTLADNRVNEAKVIIAQAAGGDSSVNTVTTNIALSEVVVTVKQAQEATNAIQDPAQKQIAQQKLAAAIQNYQDQLQSTDTKLIQQETTPTPQPTLDNSAFTPTASSNTGSPDSSDLQNQILQTQTYLQSISNQLQDDSRQQNEANPTITSTLQPTSTYQHNNTYQQNNTYQYKNTQQKTYNYSNTINQENR